MLILTEFILKVLLVDNGELKEMLFSKQFMLLVIPRIGDKIVIQPPQRDAIHPIVNSVNWRLPDTVRIMIAMSRPVTTSEVNLIVDDKWDRLQEP